jgi:predicted enzyme related to lactoylglutathione lyase
MPIIEKNEAAPDIRGAFMVKGLATVIYHVRDIDRAKAWYADAFGQPPYFDQPFYVGFNIGGYELGLDPDPAGQVPGAGGTVAYWRVDRIDDAIASFVGAGAALVRGVQDVGDGIKVASVADPFGNVIGLIENPHFSLPEEVRT